MEAVVPVGDAPSFYPFASRGEGGGGEEEEKKEWDGKELYHGGKKKSMNMNWGHKSPRVHRGRSQPWAGKGENSSVARPVRMRHICA